MEFNAEKMMRFVESDLLLNRMYNQLGKSKETLEVLFYSEVFEDSMMMDQYQKA